MKGKFNAKEILRHVGHAIEVIQPENCHAPTPCVTEAPEIIFAGRFSRLFDTITTLC